jgi:hypothetical protein
MERNGQAWFMVFVAATDAIDANTARHGEQFIFCGPVAFGLKGSV